MDYNELINAYLNNDINWLRKNIVLTECKQLPIAGATGEFEGTDDLFIEVCNWMYKNGLDVNATENNGNTGIFIASAKNNYIYAKMFINNNADVNKKCQNGYTPILVALNSSADEKLIKLLIDAGADLNYIANTDDGLFSTLEQICYNYDVKMLKYFIDNGASIEKQKEVLDTVNWDDVSDSEEKKKILSVDIKSINNKTANQKDNCKSRKSENNIRRVLVNEDFYITLTDDLYYELNKDNFEIIIYNHNPEDKVAISDRKSTSIKIHFVRPFPEGKTPKDVDISEMIKNIHDNNEKEYKEKNVNKVIAMVGKFKDITKVLVDNNEIKIGYTSLKITTDAMPLTLTDEQLVESFTGIILTNKGFYTITNHYNVFFGMPDELETFMDNVLSTAQLN